MIILSSTQILVLALALVGVPIISLLWFKISKASVLSIGEDSSVNKRNLVETANADYHKIKSIDWSSVTSGWNKGRKVDFESQNIPLIATLQDHRSPGSWKQAKKIGAKNLIVNCLKFIEKFGASTFTIAAVGDEDSARDIAWGLANYLATESSRVLVFEISPNSKKTQDSSIIEIGSKNFEEFSDPRKTKFTNVDMIMFDSSYNWPEDILKDQLVKKFCDFYREKYDVILIVAPPILLNGFARKATIASDCFILTADANDDTGDLQDAYLRIINACEDAHNESLVIWGVLEN